MRGAALVLATLLGGCGIPEHGPTMRPGENCLGCHGPGTSRQWYAAGTVYADGHAEPDQGIQGVEVVITDKVDRRISLTTNGAGNFYTAETLEFPAKVELHYGGQVVANPPDLMNSGSCNSCHSDTAKGGAVDRIYAP